MTKERDDGGVYVYSPHKEDALAVDDLGTKARKPRGKPAPEAERGAPTLPAPTPEFDLPDLTPAEPVQTTNAAPDTVAEARLGSDSVPAQVAPAVDPLIADVDRRIARGDWAGLEQTLFDAGAAGAGGAAPQLRLLWAVAVKESETKREGVNADALAIAATAELLGVAADSHLALVVAKRLLRRRALASRPAPSPWVSWIIVLVAIAIGAAVGFLFA